MANRILVGLQWGDEGKGKIIDFLAEHSDVVVRFQGGNNAGHTVEVGQDKFVLHLVPSGILRAGTLCLIGNGVVVNPVALVEELDELSRRGIQIDDRLQISTRAHLVFRYHCLHDGLLESKLGDAKIGTTKRGIGPAYADKVNRVGIRAAALRRPDRLEREFRARAEFFNDIFREAGAALLDVDAEWDQLQPAAARLAPLVQDTVLTLQREVRQGHSILFEGAQGTWLDVDYGTYPYVTSSNTTAGAACTGGGLAPARVDSVFGVAKAYTTRVGCGPFPTELDNETGEFLREQGGEYGATTGRPRRCGWFDAVATRYATLLNGVDKLAITKLDVLDSMPAIQICTAYELDGTRICDWPSDLDDISRVVPVYEEMPGWQEPTGAARRWQDLPAAARAYLCRISELVEAPLAIISTGPKRAQTLTLD